MTELAINDPATLEEITELFGRYEDALMRNDVAVLDSLFFDGPHTIRYGVGENLYGFDEIAAFRVARPGGSPPRTVLRTAIATYGRDFATTNIEFRREGGTRIGRQSQSWVRTAAGWKIVAAHVSLMSDGS
jgi:1-carboxybiuret hydrolase subunit AtzH-like protein